MEFEFIGKGLKSLFGSRNDRILKQLSPTVGRVNALEPEFERLTDEQLRAKTAEFRERLKGGESLDDVKDIYPTAEDGRITVAVVHAASIVRDLNFKYLNEGKGAPVTARFGEDGITIIDPNRVDEGADAVFHRLYTRPL